VAALVVGRDVEFDELLDVCQQHLAKYKIPEVWGRVASLRTNAMGKVNRANLGEVLKTAEVLRGS
jgi:acyl-CoA synthetase (AMP-forming)/AMP-acid ligase II